MFKATHPASGRDKMLIVKTIDNFLFKFEKYFELNTKRKKVCVCPVGNQSIKHLSRIFDHLPKICLINSTYLWYQRI